MFYIQDYDCEVPSETPMDKAKCITHALIQAMQQIQDGMVRHYNALQKCFNKKQVHRQMIP